MPKVTVTLPVLVTVDVPEEYAAKCTREDLVSMARAACPHSLTVPIGHPTGTQVLNDGVAVEDLDQQPVFADLSVEHDITAEPDIEFDDEGFETAEKK